VPDNGPDAGEEVYILLVETGRTEGDGLPDGATGAALMCHAAGRSERQAVDETVRLLRDAGMAPLEVTSYGTRATTGLELDKDELALMERARTQSAVIVAQMTVIENDAD
jgi:hypothetical protein